MEGIYDDLEILPDLDIEYKKLQQVNADLCVKIQKLEYDISNLNKELTTMKNIQKTLERNMSSLYLTARAEIERKDRRNTELQKQIDDLLYKRGKPTSSSRSVSPQNSERTDKHHHQVDEEKRDYKRSEFNRKNSYKRRHQSRSNSPPYRSDYKSKHHSKDRNYEKFSRNRDRNTIDNDSEGYRNKHLKRARYDERRSPSEKRCKYEGDIVDKEAKNEHKTPDIEFNNKEYQKDAEYEQLKENMLPEKHKNAIGKMSGIETCVLSKSLEEGEIMENDEVSSKKQKKNEVSKSTNNNKTDDIKETKKSDKKTKNIEVSSSKSENKSEIKQVEKDTKKDVKEKQKTVTKESKQEGTKLVTSFTGCIPKEKPKDLIITPNSIVNTTKSTNNITASEKYLESDKIHEENKMKYLESDKKSEDSKMKYLESDKKSEENKMKYLESDKKSEENKMDVTCTLSIDKEHLESEQLANHKKLEPLKSSNSTDTLSELPNSLNFGKAELSAITSSDTKVPVNTETEIIVNSANKGKPRPRRRGGVVTMID